MLFVIWTKTTRILPIMFIHSLRVRRRICSKTGRFYLYFSLYISKKNYLSIYLIYFSGSDRRRTIAGVSHSSNFEKENNDEMVEIFLKITLLKCKNSWQFLRLRKHMLTQNWWNMTKNCAEILTKNFANWRQKLHRFLRPARVKEWKLCRPEVRRFPNFQSLEEEVLKNIAVVKFEKQKTIVYNWMASSLKCLIL